MARVTLNHPRTYNYGSFKFEKGVPQIVDDELGKYLKDSGHFTVAFASDIEKAAPQAAATRSPRQIVADIHLAVSKLDSENKAHFTAEGKPQIKALIELLGYPITAQVRDEALEQSLRMDDPTGQLKTDNVNAPDKAPKVETTEEHKTDKGVTIKITKRRKPKAEATEKAATETDNDDSLTDTGEGVEV